jgi:hypothetical protein
VADKPVTRLASEMAAKEQKKKRGFFDKIGGFLADAGQEVGRIVTNPVETVQRLGSEAKSTFFDPIRDLPNAFDPTSGLSPMERATTGVGGGLAVADALTPFMPEGALANAMVKRAANRTLAETGTTSFAKSGPINIMGIEVPYGPEAARYAAKLKRLDETMGVAPGRGVASIGMTERDAADVLKNGIYDPILGKSGIIQEASGDYASTRNMIENFTNAPTYGYQRYPADLSTASSYRNPYNRGAGTILNIDPAAVRSMSQGDSMYVFGEHKPITTRGSEILPNIFSPYSPELLPPRPGYGGIGEDLAAYANKEGKLSATFYDTYRELQMKPINVANDVQSAILPRDLPGLDSDQIIDLRLKLAKSLAEKNIPYASGKAMRLEEILAKDIKNIGYPQDIVDKLQGVSALVPDPVPLHRLPPRWIKSWKDMAPYREVVDF